MPQVLIRSTGEKVDIDRSFVDGGEQSIYGMVGGQRVLMREGAQAKPTIWQKGESFFYPDMTPVMNLKDVEHLVEPHRSKAIAWVRKQRQSPATASTTAVEHGPESERPERVKKAKRPRKPMSAEQLSRARENLAKAREARKMNLVSAGNPADDPRIIREMVRTEPVRIAISADEALKGEA